jgi:3-oxoacyl-[acyl-carrier protein] reductase
VRLTETLAEELRPFDIQVNAIAPGAVNTFMLQETLKAGLLAGEVEFQNARDRSVQGRRRPTWPPNWSCLAGPDAACLTVS